MSRGLGLLQRRVLATLDKSQGHEFVISPFVSADEASIWEQKRWVWREPRALPGECSFRVLEAALLPRHGGPAAKWRYEVSNLKRACDGLKERGLVSETPVAIWIKGCVNPYRTEYVYAITDAGRAMDPKPLTE